MIIKHHNDINKLVSKSMSYLLKKQRFVYSLSVVRENRSHLLKEPRARAGLGAQGRVRLNTSHTCYVRNKYGT